MKLSLKHLVIYYSLDINHLYSKDHIIKTQIMNKSENDLTLHTKGQ